MVRDKPISLSCVVVASTLIQLLKFDLKTKAFSCFHSFRVSLWRFYSFALLYNKVSACSAVSRCYKMTGSVLDLAKASKVVVSKVFFTLLKLHFSV